MKAIVVVSGRLKDLPENELRSEHDSLLEKLELQGRAFGNTGHRTYKNSTNEQELMVIDVWDNVEGARKLMSNPALPEQLNRFFDGMPHVAIWTKTDWNGYDPQSR